MLQLTFTSIITYSVGVLQFGLVCDKSWYVSASQASFMAGIMVGNVVFAKIADR